MFPAIPPVHLPSVRLFGHPAPPERTVQRYTVKPWIITRVQDRADGGIDCVLSAPGRLTVYNSTVVVDLGRRADTSKAVYSAAGGALQPAQANWPVDLPQAIVDGTPAGNPSNGLVVLPLAAVIDAGWLEVRRQPRGRVIPFDLTGLKAARTAALGLGCPATAP